jgi:hypothetical protein
VRFGAVSNPVRKRAEADSKDATATNSNDYIITRFKFIVNRINKLNANYKKEGEMQQRGE